MKTIQIAGGFISALLFGALAYISFRPAAARQRDFSRATTTFKNGWKMTSKKVDSAISSTKEFLGGEQKPNAETASAVA